MTTVTAPPTAGRALSDGRAPFGSRRTRVLVIQIVTVVGLILIWQWVVVAGIVPENALARPTDVAGALWDLLPTAGFWSAVGDTVHTWVVGLAISIAIAVPVGLLLGASSLLYRLFRVTIDFLRTIPPVVLLPLALLLFGAREVTALVLVVFGSVWPLMLQSMYGVHQVDPALRAVGRAYRLRSRDIVSSIVLPSAAPFIATGIRIAVTMSLLLAIGAELLGGVPGIGAEIAVSATSALTPPAMYAYVVVATALAVVLNFVMRRIERRLLAWHSAHR